MADDTGVVFTHPKPSLGKAPATLSQLVHEPAYWHAYLSDEEVASPIDHNDDISLYSIDSIDSIAAIPEQLVDHSTGADGQCNRAQAVKIQSCGKATMVSMPKIIDVRAQKSPRLKSVDHISSGRSSQDSRNDSINSSYGKSPLSTAPSSIYDERQVKRRKSFARHVPLMEAAQRPSPASPTQKSPRLPRSVYSVKRVDTILSDRSSRSSASAIKSAGMRRMNMFSSNFSLSSRVGKDFARGTNRRESTSESRKGGEEREPVFVTQQVLQPQIPTRRSSVQIKPKMVARAANERAPPIILPPCPDDPEDDEWPLRKQFFAAQSKHQLRRQTISGRITSVV